MPQEDLAVRRDLVIPAREIVETASRAGGPGGQHVNKTSTRVTLHWNARESVALTPSQRTRLLARAPLTRSGEIVVHAGGSRSRAQNREEARRRLSEIVSRALRRQPRRVPTRPSKSAVKRRVAAKRRRAQRKQQRRRPAPDD